jgi:WD40 repeat protein
MEVHGGSVVGAAFSPDGRRLAAASQDLTARVWDEASGAMLARLEGHKGSVVAAAFSPDGRRLATASWDKTARVWDAAAGAELARLEGHKGSVVGAAFSPDGRRLATKGRDHTARVWDVTTGAELARLEGHEDEVVGAAFSPDGRRLATASTKIARVWDADSGACLKMIRGCFGAQSFDAPIRAFPFHAMSQGWETMIKASDKGTAVAWFPTALKILATHPSGRLWAASDGHNLYFIRLEGRPEGR